MKKKVQQESSDSDSEEVDSDEELQEAFARGELKPGLNTKVAAERTFANHVGLMKVKLDEFKSKLEWIERLDLTTSLDGVVDNILADKEKIDPTYKVETAGDRIVDDLQRETLFYRQAQAAALEGLARVKVAGFPTKRPSDYFAQMAKSDDHMLKVKRQVLTQQLGQEKAQKVKKLRELKKFGKKVQVEVGLQRAKEKREMLAKVKQFRDGKLDSLDFLDEDKGKKKNFLDITKQKSKEKNETRPNLKGGGKKKRESKDKKFGFGGKKSGSKKSNLKKSEAEGGAGRKSARPGKSKRQAAKTRGGGGGGRGGGRGGRR